MESWQVLIAVASLALVGVTVVLARFGSVPVPAATARVCGYAATGALALIGVPPFVAIVPAVVGVIASYVFVIRAPRADQDEP